MHNMDGRNNMGNTMETQEIDMDRIFFQYCEDRASEKPRALKEWMADHPELKDDFILWATDIPAMSYALTIPTDYEQEQRTAKIGLTVLSILGVIQETVPVITDLYLRSREHGLSPKQLATMLGVGISVIAKLQNRLISAESIPSSLMNRLTQSLKCNLDQVTAYLNQPPTLAAGVMYKAASAPTVSTQQSFRDAVENALDMSESQKSEWLNGE